jgi:flagellar motor switch protein FliM
MNRLLINMKNKVDTINGAIDMIYRLKKGETITLNGLNTISVSLENNKDFDTNKRLCELFEERENLQVRINRMGG